MDSSIRISPFRNGVWMWDEINHGLIFVSKEPHQKTPSLTNTNVTVASKQTVANSMRFRETTDALEQIRFRRHYQRKCKPTEPEVVTIQDVKDVVLYILNPKQITIEFINYFHMPTMDRFLRSLIVYFQLYVQIWDHLLAKREEKKTKLRQPITTELENIIRDDLADIRSLVSREYCSILVGAADTKKFHHMSNKNNESLSEKDRRLFETLISVAVRVVWVALQRKYLSIIELEMNRLLRSDTFNVVVHKGVRLGTIFNKLPEEERILLGASLQDERKLLKRSPAARELLFGNHDHRLLCISLLECEPRDKRIEYLEAAFAAPEELLLDLGVTVGILGIPRNELDAMLQAKERTSKSMKAPRELPEFIIPPVLQHRDEEMAKTFPKKLCQYSETEQTKKARKAQLKMWRKYVRNVDDAFGMSRVDLSSATLSHSCILMQSKHSLEP